ncbi:hypothetical protein [Halomarina litorea]|uniref:hypothetical protein n=1 Tax=Halomarina litorea TaxID=2961595 RepID=UPI0020C25658|nr:hypothetical protein [Halomarina sp. BCD28]
MHMVIYALVAASTEDDALAAGTTVFDGLVGGGVHTKAVFDYYVTFDEEGTTVAGQTRWGDLPVAAPVDSEDGQALLERGWTATEKAFQRHLERAKEALEEYDDEAIMRDQDLVRHTFHQLGAYRGSSIALYDEHGNGIRHREQLDRRLEASGECWIVPADVHY